MTIHMPTDGMSVLIGFGVERGYSRIIPVNALSLLCIL